MLGPIEELDCFEEELLASLPIAQTLQARATKHCPARSKALAYTFDGRARAERKAAKVEVGHSELGNQFTQVPRKNAFRIVFGAVRPSENRP